MRPHPDAAVLHWIAAQSPADLHIAAITVAEMLFGLAIMPAGQRRTRLEDAARTLFEEKFEDNILPFDHRAAGEYAALASARKRSGKPIPIADLQIAAIAISYGASLATRNMRDFEGCGLTLINPWEA